VKSVDPDLGRRERKKRETRRALRVAALRLVAERGLDDVTVQDIADSADVSTRTFFNHFACKEDALVGMDPGGVEKLCGALAAQSAGAAPLEALRSVLVGIAGILEERGDELLLQIRVSHENPQLRAREMAGFAQYERVLVADLAARSGTDPTVDVYPALAAGAGVAALRAALGVWRHTGGATSLAVLVGRAFDRLAEGLPPPGTRRPARRPRGSAVADPATVRLTTRP
jgi:AcrR family transcriptional regulator